MKPEEKRVGVDYDSKVNLHNVFRAMADNYEAESEFQQTVIDELRKYYDNKKPQENNSQIDRQTP